MRIRISILLACVIVTAQSGMAYGGRSTIDERVIGPAPALPMDTSSERFGSRDVWNDLERAAEFYDLQELDSAFNYYDRVITANPNLPDAYIGRGVCFLIGQEDSERAIADFRRALELSPENALVYNNIGMAHLFSQPLDTIALDSARANLDIALSIFHDFPLPHFNFGLFYDTIGLYDSSLASFNRAISLGYEAPDVYTFRSFVLHKLGKREDAIRSLCTAMSIDSTYWPALYYQGRMFLEGGAFLMANIKFGDAIELALGEPAPYYFRGKSYVAQQEFDRALDDFSVVDSMVGDDCVTKMERGSLYFLQTRYEEAIQQYTMLIGCDSLNTMAHYLRAASYVAQSSCDSAILDFSWILEMEPFNSDALDGRSACYAILQEPDSAIVDLNRLIEVNPTKGVYYLKRARLHRKKGDYLRSSRDFREAYRLNTKLESALLHSGISSFRSGEYEFAVQDFERFINAKYRDRDLAYFYRAQSFINLGKFDMALSDLQELVEWHDSWRRSQNRRSRARFYENQENRPGWFHYEYSDILTQMARAYAALGDHKNAKKSFRRAASKGKENSDVHFYYAEYFKSQGKLKDAKKYFEKAIKYSSDSANPLVILSREYIEEIEQQEQ